MSGISISKKITAIIAALILLYNSSGYILVYQQLIMLTKYSNHLAIERKQVKEKIILLSFLKSDIENKTIDFIWKHSKEFKFNGSMYDIVDRIDTEDSVHFYCFLDKKENKLKADFNKHFEHNKEDKKNNSSGRALLALQVMDMFSNNTTLNPITCSNKKYSPYFEQGYLCNEPEIPSPPPKV